MPDSPPRVFISYSHDSPEHKDWVLVLCDRLRSHGIDARIDQYETSPPEGWPRWCAAQVREADFVLIACTETYERRFRGAEEPGRGLGAVWEGYVAAQEIYEAGSRNTKFIPVVLNGGDPSPIPDVLRGATHYELGTEEGYWRLYRRLTGQPKTVAPPVGERVTLPKQERKTDIFFYAPEPRYEDDRVKGLSEALEAAYGQLEEETTSGKDTTHIRAEILRIRRDLRDGPRLQAGEFLSDGRFRLIEVLGRGGFATVWKAFDRKRHELVAVKVLHGQHAEDRSRRERFFRGARKMAELQHPGIVRIIEAHLEESGYHYFVMEYVGGGDLRHAVLSGSLAPGSILPTILEIGEALAFAHEKGIIHRDVKPENILLDGEHPKLTDFDLVRALDTTGGTQTQGQFGTFLYTAPEVQENAKDVGARADVYSFAMTATFAFHGRILTADVWRHTDAFVEGLPCSAAIRAALRRGIAWKAGERPASIRDLCKALRRGAEQTPPSPEEIYRLQWERFPLGSSWAQATDHGTMVPPPPLPPSLSIEPGGSSASHPPMSPLDGQAATVSTHATRPTSRGPLIVPGRTILAASVAALFLLAVDAILLGWLWWTTPQTGRDARQDEQQKEVIELVRTGSRSLRSGDPKTAASAFRQAEQIAPEKQKPPLRSLRMAAEEQAQEFGQLVGRQKLLVEHLIMAQQAMDKRRFQEAVAEADAALALDPANVQAQQMRTAAQKEQTRLEE